MGVDDLFEPEVGFAVAATAALMSPRSREVMRRGVVYGLAGVLKTGDAVASTARGAARGVRRGANGASPDGKARPSRASGARSSSSRPRTQTSGSNR